MQRRTSHLGGVDDSGLHEVDVLASCGIESHRTLFAFNTLHHKGAFHAGIVSNVAGWSIKGFPHGASTSGLVTSERIDNGLHRGTGTQQCGSASGHNAFFDCCTSCRDGVFDAVLLFLEFNFGGCANLDQSHTAGQLGQTLLQLFTIPVGIGVFDFGLDLIDATFDVRLFAIAIDNGGFVLGHDDALGTAEKIERYVFKLEANFFADDLATSENCHVLQHCFATITKARSLHSN